MNELGVPVFQLADKYLVADLRETMEECLAQEVDEDNMVKMALLADAHSADTLKQVGDTMGGDVVCAQ